MRSLFITLAVFAVLFTTGCGENNTGKSEEGSAEGTTQVGEATTETNKDKQAMDSEVVPRPKGIELNELKTLKFFGVEPGWTLTFKDDHMIYTEGYEGEDIKMLYYGDLDGSNQRLKQLSEREVQVRLVPEMAKDKAYIWTATIKKEDCSDGMSDNTYPYSISIDVEEGTKTGCGRKI